MNEGNVPLFRCALPLHNHKRQQRVEDDKLPSPEVIFCDDLAVPARGAGGSSGNFVRVRREPRGDLKGEDVLDGDQ